MLILDVGETLVVSFLEPLGFILASPRPSGSISGAHNQKYHNARFDISDLLVLWGAIFGPFGSTLENHVEVVHKFILKLKSFRKIRRT